MVDAHQSTDSFYKDITAMTTTNSEALQSNSHKRKHSDVRDETVGRPHYPYAPQPTVYYPPSVTRVSDTAAYGYDSWPTTHSGFPYTTPYLPDATRHEHLQSAHGIPTTYDGALESTSMALEQYQDRTTVPSYYAHGMFSPPIAGLSHEVIDLVDDNVAYHHVQPHHQPHVLTHDPIHQPPTAYLMPPEGTLTNPLDISSSSEADAKDYIPHKVPSLAHYAYQPLPPASAVVPNGVNPSDPTADVVPILEPELCKEQADLVELILNRRNVFYTGSAGCGKSTVLKAFVKRFREQGLKVDIVAPTGRAALDINGSTTWTYAGSCHQFHSRGGYANRVRMDT